MPQLPEWDQEDLLVAIARDPRTIFAYWELLDETRRKHEGGFLLPSWILRLTDLQTGAISDIAISLSAEQHYCSALPGHSYHIALGVKRAKFQTVLDGGIVEMPRRASSNLSSWFLTPASGAAPRSGEGGLS